MKSWNAQIGAKPVLHGALSAPRSSKIGGEPFGAVCGGGPILGILATLLMMRESHSRFEFVFQLPLLF